VRRLRRQQPPAPRVKRRAHPAREKAVTTLALIGRFDAAATSTASYPDRFANRSSVYVQRGGMPTGAGFDS